MSFSRQDGHPASARSSGRSSSTPGPRGRRHTVSSSSPFIPFGLAVPFVLATLAINVFLNNARTIHKFMRVIMVVSGLVLIIFGIMLLTNSMGRLSGLFPDFGIKL
ncbi:MAG: cytochrome c biogenesis protein CcdA [Desulfobacterales bacterium]|nr:cytochrome c biogenesis protein CcdA [Desulfobacterales bacterium]